MLPQGVRPAAVAILGGRIVSVRDFSETGAESDHVWDVGELVVSPGLVDTHVHVNQPGRTNWEGFRHAGRAAAAGGVTTLVDMPLNSIPPTTTIAGLRQKLESASGRVRVDVGFYGGVVPGNLNRLRLLHAAGVLAFKCFLVDSGVAEFPPVSVGDLRAALKQLNRLGARLMVHAELAPKAGGSGSGSSPPFGRSYAGYLASRPESWETEAVRALVEMSEETTSSIHVVHLASKRALELLREARRRGLSLTVETCPHYLTAAAEEIEDGATLWKCAPPIRRSTHREALWKGLREGAIDMVVSDHSPSPPALKHLDSGDFDSAWGGISSLQLGLSLIWTEARRRGFNLLHLSEWMSTAPASLVSLANRKGRIAPGLDADLVIWDPEAQFTVTRERWYSRHPVTPYMGKKLNGRVHFTLLRGKTVYREGAFPGRPSGRLLLRPAGAGALSAR